MLSFTLIRLLAMPKHHEPFIPTVPTCLESITKVLYCVYFFEFIIHLILLIDFQENSNILNSMIPFFDEILLESLVKLQ